MIIDLNPQSNTSISNSRTLNDHMPFYVCQIPMLRNTCTKFNCHLTSGNFKPDITIIIVIPKFYKKTPTLVIFFQDIGWRFFVIDLVASDMECL